MRIPLDYYRVLGLPVQVSHEQLQQAYRDRILQLPRREYSEAAIAARKKLLAAAYAVLSDPQQRAQYDATYLSRAFEDEDQVGQTQPGWREPYTPSIEIPEDQLVGALLILQELGEYELALKLSRPYLGTTLPSIDSEASQFQRDIILTVALAYLELGREQWQQGQYEDAATTLKTGEELLLREGIFPALLAEFQADIAKLRPYRVLELLALPEARVAERRRGMQLLQLLLQERGGIDGTSDDGSGLNLDDFLRFIQQLRSYLTVAEQQSLFTTERQQHPSAVATYLAIYALIAKGFTQRQPSLLAEARALLIQLGSRQNLYLEQAICSLLLGQTEQASQLLEQSQEYEAVAYIRENSQGSGDLLPGLCLYTERWLQTEVFPHFRDLGHQTASIQDYFADEKVQADLEALPTEVEATTPNQTTTAIPSQSHFSWSKQHSLEREQNQSKLTTDPATLPSAERIAAANANTSDLPNRRRSRRRRNNHSSSSSVSVSQSGRPPRRRRQRTSSSLTLRNIRLDKQMRLIGLLVFGLLAVAVVGFLVKHFSTTARQNQPVVIKPTVPVNQLPTPVPSASSSQSATELLTQTQAQAVIQTWLTTKAAALGPNYDIASLNQILVNPALSQWQQLAQTKKANNQYLKYKDSLKINAIKTSQTNPDQAEVNATVDEAAQAYQGGKLNQDASYNETLHVRYNLVRQGGQWRISNMEVQK